MHLEILIEKSENKHFYFCIAPDKGILEMITLVTHPGNSTVPMGKPGMEEIPFSPQNTLKSHRGTSNEYAQHTFFLE